MDPLTDTVDFVVPPHPRGWDRPRLFSALTQVDIFGLSHRGHVRPKNEDHFFVARFGRYLERLLTNLPENEMPGRLEETGYGVVVADGIGGSAAGEVASRLAISTLLNLVLGTPDWILRTDDTQLWQEVRRRAMERYEQIGSVMTEQIQVDPSLKGFGTTMTMGLSLGRDLFIAHIGDTRVYLLRNNKLSQLTRDHTWAQELVDKGLLAPEKVDTHRLRHVLTKALGSQGGAIEPDIQEVVLEDGDFLLFCSDGLTGMVEDARIAEILGEGATASKACHDLVEEALKGGGKDNVTVVVARYGFPQEIR